MRIACLIGLLAIGWSSGSLAAEDADPHRQAAEELWRLFSSRDMMIDSSMAMMELSLAEMAKTGVPEEKLNAVRKASRRFSERCADDPDMLQEMLDLYEESFTEEELRGLIEFYRTPLGLKTLQVLPILMQDGMKIGEQVAMKHYPEFQQEVQAILSQPEEPVLVPEAEPVEASTE